MSLSEQLLQVVPQKIGKYLYYRLGETTINQLVNFGLIPKIDYGALIAKKPDGLIVHHKEVKGIVEAKSPDELNTTEKENIAISQEKDVAKKLCKLLIITDNSSKTLWINPLNGGRIKEKNGSEVRAVFDAKFTKNVNEIERLIEEIDLSINETNSTLREEKIIDPSDLARQMWQTIWVATGKSPIKCLYNVVELLIFKFLSDLKVLEDEYAFNHVYEISKTDPEEALTFYARNSRVKILELFPEGKDKTTLINGTIFVNESGKANLSQAVLFHHSLKHLYEYEYNFGTFIKIDKSFKTKLYETFLKQEVEALGQYFTTRKIVQSMIRLSKLDEEEFDFKGKRICDPFCGVGGFLLEILNLNDRMKQCYTPDENGVIDLPFTIHGFDKGFEKDDERTIILAKANMLIYLTDIIFRNPNATKEFARVFNETFTLFRDNLATFAHIIEKEDEKYDYILTNPPYVTRGARVIKEEIKTKGLKQYYPINASGLEGISIEWVVRSLKKGGKAFIIVPDGVAERELASDKRLREYIIQECYLDAIISLPVRTFFANFRKTYIIAITKKAKVDDVQKHGVFTYLVSDIGEDLTKKRREEIPENDLPEMEKLFALYSAIKDSPSDYPLIKSQRCKILTLAELELLGGEQKRWRIEKFWSETELKEMKLLEDKVELQTVLDSLENSKEYIRKLMLARENIPISAGQVKVFKVSDLFDFESEKVRGYMKYTKKYCRTHKGDYPVYSGMTYNDGLIAMIDHYDYDVKQCLTWTADGVYAGTVFLREGKFSMTYHSGILLPKGKLAEPHSAYDVNGIYLPYVYHVLNNKLRKFALGQEKQNKRVTVRVMKDIEIEMPIMDEKTFDKKKQEEMSIQYNALELALDEAVQAKNEAIEMLKNALGR
ncbi:MAG: N-6 DNA methylase [Candidatus Bathyarchaeia archaeon]|jgi:type I restriction-modification system DNA methylase subunit